MTGQPWNKHDMQIEKWKVGETLYIHENLNRRTNF